ncbi:MAG: glycosyltransferase family 4 protein [Candidatus Bathyarchaeota archaeon]|nr:glycosyltransferase family 4 protein [Candidatus Bathyarchaeum tardum]WGM89857.1 MAG: glycosyltransferase family 4 protein [Candidatus Bathyarchaeum tardum]WNZ30005.1 MAG: glycosyltransferase family 4 protein [Candidatus Bathyarchaeota archaeon]
MRKLKIAVLTEFFHPHVGGCERRLMEIGRRLATKGHDIHVFTIQYDRNLPKKEKINGIIVHRYAHSENYVSLDGFRSFRGIMKYSLMSFVRLLGTDYDIYYFNQWPMLHSIFAKPVAAPLIQEWCEVWTNYTQVTLMQKLLKYAGDYHVAVSDFTRQRLSKIMKIDPSKSVLIPNGVDFAKFNSSRPKVWGRIVYAGRVVPHKHVKLLVNAFSEVKKRIPTAELHIIGSGSKLQSVKKRAMDIKDCYVHGFLPEDEMIDLLKSAWLFVLPSEREGSGIVVLEAMASGVPFVTIDHPDNATKELCLFKCGLTVEPKETSIAEAITQLFNNEELWKEMHTNALKFAKKNDWDIVTNCMEDFFVEVVKNANK